MAAPVFVASGAVDTGTTALDVAYPAGIQSGDFLLLTIANKYPTNGPSTPSGWTAPTGNQASGGSGSAGADIGEVYVTVFTRQADGTESGTLAVTITGGNSCVGRMVAYRQDINQWSTFVVECQSGSDNTAGTAWSVATAGSLDVEPDDVVVAVSAINTDAYSYSAQSLSITGATFAAGVERYESGTTAGDDCELVVSEHTVTAGTVDDVATFTMTASSTTTDRPAGATVLVRVREVEDSTLAAVLLHQEVSALTVPPGAARLLHQEVSALTVPTGAARLLHQEVLVLIGTPENQTFTTGSAALNFSATTPTVTAGEVTAAVASADLSFSAQAPTVTVSVVTVTTGSADLSFSAQPPTVTGSNVAFTTGVADLTFTAQSATVYGSNQSFATGTVDLTFTAQAPTVATGTAFTTGSGALDFTAQPPTVTVGAATVTTGSANLTLNAQVGTLVTGSTSLVAGSADLTFNAQTVTITVGGVTAVTGPASLLFGAQSPIVDVSDIIQVGSASFRFIATAAEPEILEPTFTTGSAVLVLTAQAPGLTVIVPPMDGEVPTGYGRQGDSTFETYKRKSFNA